MQFLTLLSTITALAGTTLAAPNPGGHQLVRRAEQKWAVKGYVGCNDRELGSGAFKLNMTNLAGEICEQVEYKEVPAWSRGEDDDGHLLGTAQNLIWDHRDGKDKGVQILGINLVKTDPWTPTVDDCKAAIKAVAEDRDCDWQTENHSSFWTTKHPHRDITVGGWLAVEENHAIHWKFAHNP